MIYCPAPAFACWLHFYTSVGEDTVIGKVRSDDTRRVYDDLFAQDRKYGRRDMPAEARTCVAECLCFSQRSQDEPEGAAQQVTFTPIIAVIIY
jgi:hypothetical protein